LSTLIAYTHHGAGEKGPASRIQTEELGHFKSESTVDVRAIIAHSWVQMTRVGEHSVSEEVKREMVRQRWMGDVIPQVATGGRYQHLRGKGPLQAMGYLLEGEIDRYKLERGIYGKPKGMFSTPGKTGSESIYEGIFKRWGVSEDSWKRAHQIGGHQLDRFVNKLYRKGLQPKEAELLVAGKLRGRRLPGPLDFSLMSKSDKMKIAKSLPIFSAPPAEDIAVKKAHSVAATRLGTEGSKIRELVESPGQLRHEVLPSKQSAEIIEGAPQISAAPLSSHIHFEVTHLHPEGFNKDLVDRELAKQLRRSYGKS